VKLGQLASRRHWRAALANFSSVCSNRNQEHSFWRTGTAVPSIYHIIKTISVLDIEEVGANIDRRLTDGRRGKGLRDCGVASLARMAAALRVEARVAITAGIVINIY